MLAVGPNSRTLVGPSSKFPMTDWRESRFLNVLEDGVCITCAPGVQEDLKALDGQGTRVRFKNCWPRGRRAVPGRIKMQRTAQFHLKPVPRLRLLPLSGRVNTHPAKFEC